MKNCHYCRNELIRKVWFGKRKYIEATKRFGERQFCDNVCRSKQLSIDGKGEKNYFFGKHLKPWNYGNRVTLWRTKDSHGYIRICRFNKDGKTTFRYEHRVVWEKTMNTKLSRKDVIHHINGIGIDNRIENLLLCNNKTHRRFHCKKT